MNAVSESIGTKLLNALLNEIRQIPKPWEQIAEREQEVVIFRLREAVEKNVRHAVTSIQCAAFPRLAASVEQVTFKDGVKAVLTLMKGQDGCHQLADAAGGQVMIVLANPAQFTEGMELVKADADQADMFEREQAATEASKKSWDELLESLEQPPPDESAPPKSMGQQCQELLAKVNVVLPVEVCESWTEQECTVAAYWAITFARDPNTAPARPHWLPLPGTSDAAGHAEDQPKDDDAEAGNDEE